MLSLAVNHRRYSVFGLSMHACVRDHLLTVCKDNILKTVWWEFYQMYILVAFGDRDEMILSDLLTSAVDVPGRPALRTSTRGDLSSRVLYASSVIERSVLLLLEHGTGFRPN